MTLFFCWALASMLSPQQAYEIGQKVWQNECGQRVDQLLHWNPNEEFASLGIGHFIWYPIHNKGPFVETFPELILFFKNHNVEMPRWMEEARGCPWKSREDFLRAQQCQNKQMVELQNLLQKTITLQTEFLYAHHEAILPSFFAHLPEQAREKIKERYDRIAKQPSGLYALLDYVNFKGWGTEESERYQGKGWGLLQVLELMNDSSDQPLESFIVAARAVLEERVRNSPTERREQNYLKGWILRVNNYAFTLRFSM